MGKYLLTLFVFAISVGHLGMALRIREDSLRRLQV
jgi:hypothetical protein